MPESLRWLLTRGKTRRAKQVSSLLANRNQRPLPPTTHAHLDHLAAHVYMDVPWGTVFTLFRSPRLRRHTLVLVYLWSVYECDDFG